MTTFAQTWDTSHQNFADYQRALMQQQMAGLPPPQWSGTMDVLPPEPPPPPKEPYLGTNNTFHNCVITDGTNTADNNNVPLADKIAKAKPGESIFLYPSADKPHDEFTKLHNHDFHKLLDEFERLKNG